MMSRTQEPENMTFDEEVNYANADFDSAHNKYVSEIIENVGSESNVVLADVGCGPGDILCRIKKNVRWELYGLDVSENMLALAKKRETQFVDGGRAINWINVDAKGVDAYKNKFDVVISNSVLHHMNGVAFWKSVKNIAKNGAKIFVRDLRRPEHPYDAAEIMKRYVGNEPEVIRRHYLSSLHSAYTVQEVEEDLKAVGIDGLQVLELEDRYLDIVGTIKKAS